MPVSLPLRAPGAAPLIAAVLLSLSAGPPAMAQVPWPLQRAALPASAGPMSAGIAAPLPSAPAPGPVLPVADHPDFWIVSSRQCPQAGHGPWVHCPFGYYRCGPGGLPRPFDRQTFLDWLRPGVPVCIVVHGSFTDWETVCQDAERTWRWLQQAAPGRPFQFIFYSWPSEGFLTPFPVADLGLLGRRSGFNGLYLAQLISKLPPDSPVCLIGHSHGARASAAALHLMAGGEVQGFRFAGPPDARPVRAVFAAAAIDRHWLFPGERYGCALMRAESILNLRNSADLALVFYPLRRPLSNFALGQSGLSPHGLTRLGPWQVRYTELDVTGHIRTGHAWPNYYAHPELAAAIAPWVFFADRTGAEPCPPSWTPTLLPEASGGLPEPPLRPVAHPTRRTADPPLQDSLLGPIWETTPTSRWADAPQRR